MFSLSIVSILRLNPHLSTVLFCLTTTPPPQSDCNFLIFILFLDGVLGGRTITFGGILGGRIALFFPDPCRTVTLVAASMGGGVIFDSLLVNAEFAQSTTKKKDVFKVLCGIGLEYESSITDKGAQNDFKMDLVSIRKTL